MAINLDLVGKTSDPIAFTYTWKDAVLYALGVGLALLSIAGSLYITVGLVRRAVASGRRWSAGRPRRRVLALLAALACVVPLSVIWLVQGEFSDW